MSRLYNKFNIEKEVLGEVFELPKRKKPIDLVEEQNDFIFNQVKNIKYNLKNITK